jgi:WD40 repeat protein
MTTSDNPRILLTSFQVALLNKPGLRDLIYDAHRFVQSFISCIEEHPLLVYTTALPMTPIDTTLYAHFGDGNQFPWVTGDLDRLWSPLRLVLPHDGVVHSLTFTPDGSRIVSSSFGNTIHAWDVHTGSRAITPIQERGSGVVRTISLSPDGRRILSLRSCKVFTESKYENSLYVLDLPSGGRILGSTNVGHGYIHTALFSPNGAYIACGSGTTIHLLDAESDFRILSSSVIIGSNAITCLAFFPDSMHIVSGSANGDIHILDVNADICILRPLAIQEEDKIYSFHVSADASQLRSLTSGGIVCVRNLQANASIITVVTMDYGDMSANDYFSAGNFSGDGMRVVLAKYSGSIVVCDANSGAQIRIIANGSRINRIAVSPDGRMIASNSSKSVRLWDITPTVQSAAYEIPTVVASAPQRFVSVPSYSFDGTVVAFIEYVGHEGLTIRFMDVISGQKLICSLRDHVDDFAPFALSPDGCRVVFSLRSGGIYLWNAVTETVIHEILDGHSDQTTSADFSPDGTRIVSASSDGTICVWDAIVGARLVGPWRAQSNDPRISVTFSPDGTQIVSGGCHGNGLYVWDTMSGTVALGPLDGAADIADSLSVAFSQDGAKIIARSDDDGSSIQWDAASGTRITVESQLPRAQCLCRAQDRFILDFNNWIIDTDTFKPITRLASITDTVQVTASSRTSMAFVTHANTFVLNLPPNVLTA